MPSYSEQHAREAVASSLCYSEALRKLGLRPAGGNHRMFRRYVDEIWRIPTDHFDPKQARAAKLNRNRPIPLDLVLVTGSDYSRAKLKERLYASGLKSRNCELCGQGEEWGGARMSLILDHVNGVPDDNRVENLRIVCPNCAATLETRASSGLGASTESPIPRSGSGSAGTSTSARWRCGDSRKRESEKTQPELR